MTARKSFWKQYERNFLSVSKISETAAPPRMIPLPSNSILIELKNDGMESEFHELIEEAAFENSYFEDNYNDKRKFLFTLANRTDFCIFLRLGKKFICKLDPIFEYLDQDIVKYYCCIKRKRGINLNDQKIDFLKTHKNSKKVSKWS